MDGIGFLSGLGRSNILKYDATKKGTYGTLYIDYDNNVGYIWNQADNNYTEVFNSSTTKGLTFKGLYDESNLPDTKSAGDFWITNDGTWKIWNGTKLVDYDDTDSSYGIEIIKESQDIILFDYIYLVDTSNEDIELNIPLSINSTKGKIIKIIKISTDTNSITVNITRNSNTYLLSDNRDYIELISTGNETYDWAISDMNIISNPISYVEFKGGSNNTSKADNNWKIISDTSNLLIQRYENGEAKTMAKLGQNITSNSINMTKPSGKITFTNSNGIKKTLISPSRDINGVSIGNQDGRISLINDGQLFNITFKDTSSTNTINSDDSESVYGNEFSYNFTTNTMKSFESGTISIKNAPSNTRVRISILDTNYNILAENVSDFDFNSSVISGGSIITTGENIITLEDKLILPSEYNFILKFNFSNSIYLNGATINLNDGYGSRFIPTLSFVYYEGTSTEIVHEDNIKEIIESLDGTDRINSKSIYDGIFIVSSDLELTSDYVNNTIILTHTSGTINCTISDNTIFTQGDKLTIHSKYSNAKFIDSTNDTTVEIKENDTIILQKGYDNTWCVISKFVSEGYGNKLYYLTNSTNTLTRESIKNNISKYQYTVDWNIGDNNFDMSVDSIGNYYIYFILPTDFTVDGYKYVETCVLNGISYDIFVSTDVQEFTSLSEIITAGVYTDVLGYNDGVPSNKEILVGDGTRLGIIGSGVSIDDVALESDVNTTFNTLNTNKANIDDILNGICLAMKSTTAQTIEINTDTLILFDNDSDLSYNTTYSGLTYSNGLFTNNTDSTIVLSISYQAEWSDSLTTDRTLWISNDTRTIELNVNYGMINMALGSNKSMGIYVNNATSNSIDLLTNIQIINISPLK